MVAYGLSCCHYPVLVTFRLSTKLATREDLNLKLAKVRRVLAPHCNRRLFYSKRSGYGMLVAEFLDDGLCFHSLEYSSIYVKDQ